MDHGPSTQWGKDKAADYKKRLGLGMLVLYSLLYAAFVAINSIWPGVMEIPVGSLNLAVFYGFALIVVALVLAVIYNALSSRAEERYNDEYTDDEQERF